MPSNRPLRKQYIQGITPVHSLKLLAALDSLTEFGLCQRIRHSTQPQLSRRNLFTLICTSVKNISIRAEWLRQSGRAPSEPWDTPRWRITLRPASIQCVAFHIALWSLFHSFFSFCRSPILNDHSGVVVTVSIRQNWFIGYALASGLQCNGWRCENLSSHSFYLRPKCNSVFTRYTGLQGDGWRWEYLSSRSFYLRAICHALFTNYTHHSTSPDVCGYWQSIVRPVRLLSYY
jgi:hypothetical protein